MLTAVLRRSLFQSLVTAVVCVVAVMASVVASAPANRPPSLRMERAALSSTTCPGLAFNGQWYCTASIVGVTNNAYGRGQRVVLQSVSVEFVSSTTVIVDSVESVPCPAGQYCGASLVTRTLTLSWSNSKGQPTQPRVGATINLFGTTIPASLTPVGYQELSPSSGCGYYC